MFDTLNIKETIAALKSDELKWTLMVGGENKKADLQITDDYFIVRLGGLCIKEIRYPIRKFKAKKARYENRYVIRLDDITWLEGEPVCT